MGDFSALDLWQVSYMNVSVDTPCAGCGERLKPDDRCYGQWDKIWHTGCWPKTTAVENRRETR